MNAYITDLITAGSVSSGSRARPRSHYVQNDLTFLGALQA